MGAFTVYAIEVAVIMSVLYLGYKWMLSTSTFHRFNRTILILIYAVSFILPLAMPFVRFATEEASVSAGLPVAVAIPDDIDTAPMTERHIIKWGLLAEAIYALGICVAFAISLISVIKMARLFYTGRRMEEYRDVVVSPVAPGPFSWGNVIMIRPCDIDDNLPTVVAHERAHLSHYHWLDLIMSHIVIAFQWFSPASYLMMREMRIVHEYEVDEEISRHDPYSYQMMLIKKAAGSSFPTFADSLNSQLKLRITMMLSKKSNGSRRFAALALIPMAAIAVVGLSQPAVASVLAKIAENDANPTNTMESALKQVVSKGEFSKSYPDLQVLESNDADSESILSPAAPSEASENAFAISENNKAPDEDKEEVYVATEKMPEFPGGMKALNQFLIQNIKMPKDFVGKTRVIVRFQVSKDGSLKDFKILKSGGKECDEEAIRVLKLSPKWIPATNNDKPVNSIFNIPITFTATDEDGHIPEDKKDQFTEASGKSTSQNPDDEVFTVTEKFPEFPGGPAAFHKFLNENMKMPEGFEGKNRVLMRFKVLKDGTLTDFTLLKPSREDCDKEALRVMKLSPKWIPAENNGKPVSCYYNLPITFNNIDIKDGKESASK